MGLVGHNAQSGIHREIKTAGARTDATDLAISSDFLEHEWKDYLRERGQGGLYYDLRWRHVLQTGLAHQPCYLVARRGSAVCGALPMFLVRSLVYGRAIISLPFLNGGGIQADNDAAVAALLEHACTLSRRAGARYVELRGGDALPGLATETRKATVILPIHDGLETVWRRARPSLRNKVRKAEKLGVHVAIGTDLLSEFYGVYAQNMRRLGTPVFGKLFFETVVDQFRDDAQILVAYFENRPIGAKFVIFHKAACYFIWASSLREYSHCAPMDLLNWAAVREAVDRGCDICDFGRSNLGGSHMQFKQKWNGEVAPLPWHYLLNGPDRVPRRAGDDGRLALAARIWRLLPLPMANRLGPCLARHLP